MMINLIFSTKFCYKGLCTVSATAPVNLRPELRYEITSAKNLSRVKVANICCIFRLKATSIDFIVRPPDMTVSWLSDQSWTDFAEKVNNKVRDELLNKEQLLNVLKLIVYIEKNLAVKCWFKYQLVIFFFTSSATFSLLQGAFGYLGLLTLLGCTVHTAIKSIR